MIFITLKKRRHFQQIAKSGERCVSPFFILQRTARIDAPDFSALDPLRVGFVVTKKMKKAVTRNQIRRRLKASLQLVLKTMGSQRETLSSYDLVMVARRTCLSVPFQTLLQQMREGFDFFYLKNPRLKEASDSLKS